jgi:hypothetical protein
MSDKLDQDLDEMLSRHLRGCLDGQLGRSVARLREELSPRPRWRLWACAWTAVAAGLAVAIVMFAHRAPVANISKGTPLPEEPIAETVPPMVQSASWSRMTDEGTTLVNDRPMRRMRRKVVEEVEWYDAKDRAMVKTTTPQQQIFMIEMKTD